jgi:DNA-binding MarR family transcriptional regulator
MKGEAGSAGTKKVDGSDGTHPDLGELLRHASHAMRHRFSDVLRPWGLSPHQFRALRVISTNEPLRLRDLAEQLRISPRSVTEVVDGLSSGGLVERAPVPGDRRAIAVSTTASGRRLLRDVERAGRADSADFFGRLSDSERRQLAQLLIKLAGEHGEHGEHGGRARHGEARRSHH